MRCLPIILACLASACAGASTGGSPTQPLPPAGAPVRVLMLTATEGFRHDSIAAARSAMGSLATTGGFSLTPTEDLATLDPAALAGYDVVVFALTTGELPLTPTQRSALLAFVSGGGGFVGAHSAADTLHGWPEYHDLLGASFKEHPWTGRGSIVVEDAAHDTTAGLGNAFEITEEFYVFADNPRPRVQVLLRLDAASVGAAGDYPLAWTKTYGSGRVYYNALGHFAATWQDPRFQKQLAAAIGWTARR